MKSREIEVSARRWARAVSVREVREQLFSWRERREGKGGTEFRFTGFEERSSSWVVEGSRWDIFKVLPSDLDSVQWESRSNQHFCNPPRCLATWKKDNIHESSY